MKTANFTAHPILFLHGKYLLKEVVDIRWCDLDCVSIAPELCEEFNTRVNIYTRPPPNLPVKTADFTTYSQEKLTREVIRSFILRLHALFLNKKYRFFDKYALPLLKRKVNTKI